MVKYTLFACFSALVAPAAAGVTVPTLTGNESTWRPGGLQLGKFTQEEDQKMKDHDPTKNALESYLDVAS